MLLSNPTTRNLKIQQNPLMALQLRRFLLPSMERCLGIGNPSILFGKPMKYGNFGVHLRIGSPCCGVIGSVGRWSLSAAEEVIGNRLFSSRARKSLLCKAKAKEVDGGVQLPNGKANSWVDYVKKEKRAIVSTSSLKEKLNVIRKPGRAKSNKQVSAKGKPGSKKGNADESGKQAAEGGSRQNSTTKSNNKTQVAKAPLEKDRDAGTKSINKTRVAKVPVEKNQEAGPKSNSKTPVTKALIKKNQEVDTKSNSKTQVRKVPMEKNRDAGTKSDSKGQVAEALVKKNQEGSGKKQDIKVLQKSRPLAVVKDKGLKRPSRTEKASVNGASDVAKSGNKAMQVRGLRSKQRKLRPLYPPSGRSVVVVESPTKAKVIQQYLGDMYEVLPCHGHVRVLAGNMQCVLPDNDFSMIWEVPASAWNHLMSIRVALSSAENLILASDPDCEGEAIAWHVIEMLHHQNAIHETTTVARVVFHELTEPSIKSALQVPKALDMNLVNAFVSRRAIEYLIMYSLSRLLWKKLPICQSAGRVQSAALGLISDREMEIEQFEAQEYWTVGVEFHVMHSHRTSIPSSLIRLDSKQISPLSISSSAEVEAVRKRILSSKFEVMSVKSSKVNRSPPMPYTTPTLQQDSSNKLYFPTNHTMKLAQKLYEGVKLSEEEATGLITYIRTDGLNISTEAATDIHSFVKERYGDEFASKSLRRYSGKAKNAHEAIRPTNIRRLPSSLIGILDDDSLKLYSLIWTRTMACQMESSSIDMVQVDIRNTKRDIIFRSTGSKVGFPGCQAVYKDKEAGVTGIGDNEENASEAAYDVLHMLKVKDLLSLGEVELKQHYTKPPPRYSEGALVKKLEELGIGRPSTYASIIKVLQDRDYVTLKSRVLYPGIHGRMLSAFLSHYFSEVAEYSFTADMENELDNVSTGKTEWKGLLKDYWSRFCKYCDLATNTDSRQVENMLEEKFGHILFSLLHINSRVCPRCSQGTLVFRMGRFGSACSIGCDQHPKCKYVAGTVLDDEDENDNPPPDKLEHSFIPKLLGHCPDSNEKIFLKNGPYGYYVQVGDDRHGYTPRRASVSEVKDADSFTLQNALEALQYPVTLGIHPDDKWPVLLRRSRFGFSIRHRRTISALPKGTDPKKITLEAGLKLLKSKHAKKFGRPKGLKKTEDILFE